MTDPIEVAVAVLADQVKRHESDIRQFAPLVVEVAELRNEQKHLAETNKDLRRAVEGLTLAIQSNAALAGGQRSGRRIAWIGAFALIAAGAVTSTAQLVGVLLH